MSKFMIILLIIGAVFLVGCSLFTKTSDTQMVNPASKFCLDIGGNSNIVTISDGSHQGFCVFNGKECDEWALYRNNCTEIRTCSETAKKNTACTMDYSPVCGTDGVTYSNGCVACSSGAKAFSVGECIVGGCGTDCPQLTSPSPDFCKNGKIVAGGIDRCKCTLPPRCVT